MEIKEKIKTLDENLMYFIGNVFVMGPSRPTTTYKLCKNILYNLLLTQSFP